MNLFLISIIVTIIANVFYHICEKNISTNLNPVSSLIITYAFAFILSIVTFYIIYPKLDLIEQFKRTNWVPYGLAIAIVIVEMGYILMYKTGWNLNTGALVVSVLVALILIPTGFIFYKEQLTLLKIIGIVLSIAGLILINLKA